MNAIMPQLILLDLRLPEIDGRKPVDFTQFVETVELRRRTGQDSMAVPDSALRFSPSIAYAKSPCRGRPTGRLLVLDQLSAQDKRKIITAMVTTISHDGQVTITEAGLLRATCAALHCPMPPLREVLQTEERAVC